MLLNVGFQETHFVVFVVPRVKCPMPRKGTNFELEKVISDLLVYHRNDELLMLDSRCHFGGSLVVGRLVGQLPQKQTKLSNDCQLRTDHLFQRRGVTRTEVVPLLRSTQGMRVPLSPTHKEQV